MKILFEIPKWGNHQQQQQTEVATSQWIVGDAPPGFVSFPVNCFLEGYSHTTPHILSCHTVHFYVNIVLLLSLFNENRDFLMWKSSAYIIIPHCDYSWGQEGWSREQKEKWWAINLNSVYVREKHITNECHFCRNVGSFYWPCHHFPLTND